MRSAEEEVLEKGYDGELMRRLPPSNRVRLGTQYRMHGDIGDLVDQCFYRVQGESLASHFAGRQSSSMRRTNASSIGIGVMQRSTRVAMRR